MFGIFENTMMLVRVVVIYYLLFYLLPSGLLKHSDNEYEFGTLDRLFIYLTHSNLVTIGVVYILALIGIYETVSLLIVYLIIIGFYIWRKKSKEGIRFKDLGSHYFGKILDSSEEEGGINKAAMKSLKSLGRRITVSVKGFIMKLGTRPVESFVLIALLAVGLYARFHHSFTHLYYGSSDPYVHLAWTKYMGNNQLFRDGVYPYGYHAILSALSKIFFTDPSIIIRFIGPVGSGLMLLSLYYVLRKQIRTSLIPALAGLAVFVMNTSFPFGQIRHISALPEEYAMIFMLPGIYFLSMFFEKGKKYFLVLSAEALLITILVHPYVSVYLVIGYLLVCIMNLHILLKPANLLRTAGIMILAAAAGFLPVGLGLLSGKDFHGASIGFIRDSIETNTNIESFAGFVSYIRNDTIFTTLFICIGVLLLFSLIRLFLKSVEHKVQARAGIAITVFVAILYLQYRAPELGIPFIMDISRTSSFLAYIAAFMFGLVIASFDLITSKKYIGNIIKTIAAVAIVLTMFDYSAFQVPIKAYISDRMEYDEAAYACQKIKQDYQLNNWTIISPVEQYPEVINYGYHYNLWEYVKDVYVDNKYVEYPTEYVFWFVEKIPLNTDKPITKEDSEKPFPTITGALDEYYTVPENRRIIQAKAFYRLEDLLKINENMSVYLETDNLKVYVLRQEVYSMELAAPVTSERIKCMIF
ncbi:MAG: hypothetical protein PHV88_07580 [Eubacteriales bacterium]|nr:hypothetical protein [Eubacteriales bacterium]